MREGATILIAEDDCGHAALIRKNLERAGLTNPIVHFKDGQEVLDYLYQESRRWPQDGSREYLLILDIRMPKRDGIEVLKLVKEDSELSKMPVMVVTTTDDPVEVDKCHALGCNSYITKPLDYGKFIEAISRLGLFLKIIEVPSIGRANPSDSAS
jgi:CheY-like chemotaxis protein